MTNAPCRVCGTRDKDARHAHCKPCLLAHLTAQVDSVLMQKWGRA